MAIGCCTILSQLSLLNYRRGLMWRFELVLLAGLAYLMSSMSSSNDVVCSSLCDLPIAVCGQYVPERKSCFHLEQWLRSPMSDHEEYSGFSLSFSPCVMMGVTSRNKMMRQWAMAIL